MKIKFFEMENAVEFREGLISVLEIENKVLFKNAVLHLYKISQGEESDVAVSVLNGDDAELLKNFELVTDIFSINESAINNKIVKYLSAELENSEYRVEIFEALEALKSKILHYFDDIPFELCYNDNVSIVDLLKDFSPKLDSQVNFNYLNALNNYLKAVKMLKINNLIVFVDVKKYLTDVELRQFYENVFMLDLAVLLIESTHAELIEGYEWKLQVDNDLYEITP